MLKQLLELTAKFFYLARDVQQNKTDIKDVKQQVTDLQHEIKNLQREMQELTRGFERLAYEVRRVGENEAQERKVMALQLENEMLKFERRLPTSKPNASEQQE